jgi:hypothetical protein
MPTLAVKNIVLIESGDLGRDQIGTQSERVTGTGSDGGDVDGISSECWVWPSKLSPNATRVPSFFRARL